MTQEFYQRDHQGPADTFPDHRYRRLIGAKVETPTMGITLVMEGTVIGYFLDVAIHCQLNHGELKALTGLDSGAPFELCALTAAQGAVRPAAKLLSGLLESSLEELLVAECAV